MVGTDSGVHFVANDEGCRVISAAELGDTFGAMRIWLDENRCDAGKFETTTTSPGLIRIRMELLVDSGQRRLSAAHRTSAGMLRPRLASVGAVTVVVRRTRRRCWPNRMAAKRLRMTTLAAITPIILCTSELHRVAVNFARIPSIDAK